MIAPSELLHQNADWTGAEPLLSVLIPFHGDNPLPLLQALETEAEALAGDVEVVLLDDGSRDASLADRVLAQVERMRLPTRFVRLLQNVGRAKGRNRLFAAARGRFLLFLDSDMRPDRPDFLRTWVREARSGDAAVAFGGFAVEPAAGDTKYEVHRAHAAKSDCLTAAERSRQPEKHIFTSNLLVRRDVFESEAFASDFTGWGWEDTEWGLRVSRRYPIRHIDNTATHLGLDTTEALIAKYDQSVQNFARISSRHPDLIGAYAVHRAARMMKRLPGRPLLRALARNAALSTALPTAWRAFALRLYRAALYAEVV